MAFEARSIYIMSRRRTNDGRSTWIRLNRMINYGIKNDMKLHYKWASNLWSISFSVCVCHTRRYKFHALHPCVCFAIGRGGHRKSLKKENDCHGSFSDALNDERSEYSDLIEMILLNYNRRRQFCHCCHRWHRWGEGVWTRAFRTSWQHQSVSEFWLHSACMSGVSVKWSAETRKTARVHWIAWFCKNTYLRSIFRICVALSGYSWTNTI